MTHRKTPCDHCKAKEIDTKHKEIVLTDGSIDEIYEERCALCENLLYGFVRRIKSG